ncbi:MAG: ABC transporter permease [Euzebya sp.]
MTDVAAPKVLPTAPVDPGPRGTGFRARFAHAMRPWHRANPGARYLVIAGAIITLAFAVMAVFAPVIAPYQEAQYCADEVYTAANRSCQATAEERIPRREAPSVEHPFGTTASRFDVLSRVIIGARVAFAVVIASTVFAMVIGVPLGLFSGYIGGRFDRVTVLIMDAVYAFPSLLLAIMIAFVLRTRLESLGINAPFVPAAISVGTVYVPQYFRVIRNHTLSVKEEPFVEAARSLGAKRRTILSRYVFFNVVSSIPVLFTLNAADAVLTLAGLGFLGYGITFPSAEWGLDVAQGINDSVSGFWWTAFWPGVAITLLVTGLSLMGEGLNDIINPLLRVKGFRGKAKASARDAVRLAGNRDATARDADAAPNVAGSGEGNK